MYFRFEANWEWRKAWVEVCTGRYLFLPVLWPDGRKSMLTLVMICIFLSFHSTFFNFLQALKHQSPFSSLLSVYFFFKCYFMILTFNFKTEKKWMLFEVTYHTHLFVCFFSKKRCLPASKYSWFANFKNILFRAGASEFALVRGWV